MSDSKALERAEIIAALRYCASEGDCKGCPLGRYDAITCAGFSGMLRDAASLLERDTEPSNDPLTLEELRGMDGDPVWAGNEKEPQHFQWFFVDCCSAYKPFILINRRNNLMWQYMKGPARPNGWTAYRRKPDGGGSDEADS